MTIDILALLASIIVSASIGAIIRNNQLAAAQKKINALENEMLHAHATILELEKKGAATKMVPVENSFVKEAKEPVTRLLV